MADVQAAAALVTSVKTALDMLGNISGMRDDIKLQTVQADLKRQLLEVLDFAVTTKTAQFDLVEREQALKKEVAELKEWKAREGEYTLEEIPPGAFVQVSQLAGDPKTQEIWLCDACYQQHRRSPLHNHGQPKDDWHHNTWKCAASGCRTSLLVETQLSPGHWRHRVEQIAVGREIEAAGHAKHLAALKAKRDGKD